MLVYLYINHNELVARPLKREVTERLKFIHLISYSYKHLVDVKRRQRFWKLGL